MWWCQNITIRLFPGWQNITMRLFSVMLGKTEGKSRRNWQMMRWLDSITNSMVDVNLSKLQRRWRTRKTGVLQSIGSERVRHNLATDQQQSDVSMLLLLGETKSSTKGKKLGLLLYYPDSIFVPWELLMLLYWLSCLAPEFWGALRGTGPS